MYLFEAYPLYYKINHLDQFLSFQEEEKNYLLIENEMRNAIGKNFSISDLDNLTSFPEIMEDISKEFISKVNFSNESLDKTISILNI